MRSPSASSPVIEPRGAVVDVDAFRKSLGRHATTHVRQSAPAYTLLAPRILHVDEPGTRVRNVCVCQSADDSLGRGVPCAAALRRSSSGGTRGASSSSAPAASTRNPALGGRLRELLGERSVGFFGGIGQHAPAAAVAAATDAARRGQAGPAGVLRRRQPDRRGQGGRVRAGDRPGPARPARGEQSARVHACRQTSCCRTWRFRRRFRPPSFQAWPASPPRTSTRKSACAARR